MMLDDPDPLRAAFGDATPPERLRQRVIASLRERRLLRSVPPRWTRLAPLGLAASVALFAAGFLVGRQIRPGANPMSGGPHQYVLFLYEDADFQVSDPGEFVAEYRAWGRRIREEGRFVAGEKLRDSARLLGAATGGVHSEGRDVRTAEGALAGFFIITAKDYEEAVTIAKTHPHLKHGGRIAIREIEPT